MSTTELNNYCLLKALKASFGRHTCKYTNTTAAQGGRISGVMGGGCRAEGGEGVRQAVERQTATMQLLVSAGVLYIYCSVGWDLSMVSAKWVSTSSTSLLY